MKKISEFATGAAKMISLSSERKRVDTADTMQEKTSMANMVIQAI
jgi:hypothetical protein